MAEFLDQAAAVTKSDLQLTEDRLTLAMGRSKNETLRWVISFNFVQVYRSGNCDPRGVEPRVASPPDGDRRRGGANDGRITRRTDGGLRGVAE
jgi:hypothetical protein